MRRILMPVATLLIAGIGYLLLWPVPVQPVAWDAPAAPGYAGVHARNTRLADIRHLPLAGDEGPEHVVVRQDGAQAWVYMALASRRIQRFKPDGSDNELVVEDAGRPLGFDFDAEGALIVADAMWSEHGGLLRVTGMGAAAKIELLTNRVDHPTPNDAIRYADAVVVAKSGRIYFSDASRRFGAKASGGTFNASVLDILEHRGSGRILEFDPATRKTRVLLDGLSFANGVALSADEQHLFVAETGEYRIWKLKVDAHRLNAHDAVAKPSDAARVLINNLPGYPDNLMRGLDGRIWAGLAKPRGAFIDDNAHRPWLRALALRLPKALWPVPPAYGHVFSFDESGRVLVDLQDPTGSYPETTGVTETRDRLYIHSLHAKTLGWLPRKIE